jgi:hypothetical protein
MKEEKNKKQVTSKKANKTIPIIIVIVLILIGLGVIGRIVYRKVSEKLAGAFVSNLISKGTGGKVQVDAGGKKITYSGEGGDLSFQEGGSLPADFPGDFPLYPGAKTVSTWSANSAESKGVSVMWETSDSADKVAIYFKTELPKAGYKLTSTFEQAESKAYSFEKNDVKGLLGITNTDDKVTISVTIGD